MPIESVQTKTDWTHPIVIRNSDLLFVKDTATFADPAKAQGVLAQLVPSIEQNGQLVTITGTASKDQATSNTADLALSQQRADAVKAALVQLGVPASLLQTAGVGYDWCGWKSETDAERRVLRRPRRTEPLGHPHLPRRRPLQLSAPLGQVCAMTYSRGSNRRTTRRNDAALRGHSTVLRPLPASRKKFVHPLDHTPSLRSRPSDR